MEVVSPPLIASGRHLIVLVRVQQNPSELQGRKRGTEFERAEVEGSKGHPGESEAVGCHQDITHAQQFLLTDTSNQAHCQITKRTFNHNLFINLAHWKREVEKEQSL